MITVRSKQELEKAIKQEASEIKVVGSYATTLAKKAKNKRTSSQAATGGAILAGLLGIGCLVAAPFTAGTSLLGGGIVASAIGAGAVGLTIGTITITTTELAFLCGTVLAALALKQGYNVKITNENGKPVVIFTK